MSSLKNIIIVNDFGFINGGTSQVAIRTALELSERNYQVYYFYAVPPLDERLAASTNIRTICTNQDDILSSKNRLDAAFQGLWNRRSARIFLGLLSTLSPEETIIHVHGWIKALSHSVLHIAVQKHFPILLTLHDYFSACPNGGFYNYKKQIICPLKALSIECVLTDCDSRNYFHKLWRVVRGFIQKYIARVPLSIKNYIVLSHKSHGVLAPYLPKNARVFYLPSPVNDVKHQRIEVEKNKFIVGIGRFSTEKGFNLLAQSSFELRKEVVFIGEGEGEEELRKINPNAAFTGWLSSGEVQKILNKARLLVFPSLSLETQGLVVAEAASKGIPAIISHASTASELIDNNVTGLLFKSNDLMDLKNKISFFDNDKFAKEISQNAYDSFWANHLSQEDYYRSLISIYKKVLTCEVGSNNQQ